MYVIVEYCRFFAMCLFFFLLEVVGRRPKYPNGRANNESNYTRATFVGHTPHSYYIYITERWTTQRRQTLVVCKILPFDMSKGQQQQQHYHHQHITAITQKEASSEFIAWHFSNATVNRTEA